MQGGIEREREILRQRERERERERESVDAAENISLNKAKQSKEICFSNAMGEYR